MSSEGFAYTSVAHDILLPCAKILKRHKRYASTAGHKYGRDSLSYMSLYLNKN